MRNSEILTYEWQPVEDRGYPRYSPANHYSDVEDLAKKLELMHKNNEKYFYELIADIYLTLENHKLL